MTGGSNIRERIGAVFFAVVTVVSMMAIGGFAGTAAAAPTGVTVDSPNDVDSDGSIEVQNGDTIRVTIDTTDTQVTFALDDNGDLSSGTQGANGSSSVTISDGQSGDLDSADDTITTDIIVDPSSGTFADGADLELVVSAGGSVSGTGDINPQIVTIDDTAPSTQSANSLTADTDNDGNVDEITVDFNEEIIDANSDLSASEFALSTGTVDSVSTGASPNDDAILLQVSGVSGTDATPAVESADNGNTLDFEDEAGNTLSTSSTNTLVSPTDSAAPVLLSAVKQSGSNEVELTFSEPVQDGGGTNENTIATADLSYADNNGAGASGLSSVADDGTNDGVFTIFTSGAVTSQDIGTDQIAPFDGEDSNSGPTPNTDEGIEDRSGNTVGASTSAVVLTQQGLAGGPVAGAQFEVGGDGSADVVAGSANESLGEIKLRDDSANSDAAFAGQTQLTFPEGVTVNTSASDLTTTTVITSQNDGVDVTGVSVTNNDRTITIDHSGTSNNGEEIRIASGSVVLNVNGSEIDTSGSSSGLDVEIDTFSGTGDASSFLTAKSPDVTVSSETVAAGGDNLGGSSTVTIASGEIQQPIEGSQTTVIGNQTDLVYTLESDSGVTFDSNNIDTSTLLANTDIDGDGTDDLDASAITVTSKTITVPVVDSLSDSGGPANDIVLQNIKYSAAGDATNTNLNVTVEAPPASSGPYVTDSNSGTPETATDFVQITNPDVSIEETSVQNLAVGLDEQVLAEGGSLNDGDVAIEVEATTGSQIAADTNVTIQLNSSSVTFDTSQSVNSFTDGSGVSAAGGNGGATGDSELDVAFDNGATAIEDVTVNSDSIEVAVASGTTTPSDGDDLELGDVALNVSTTASDEANVEVAAVTRSSTAAPDVTSRSTDTPNDGGLSSDQILTLQRTNLELPSADKDFDGSNNANITFDLDGDGFEQQEVTGSDNALVINSNVAGQVADDTNVTISLEENTGVTFDTTAATATGSNSPGDSTVEVDVEDGSLSATDVTINANSIEIALSDTQTSGRPDQQLNTGTSNEIVVDDLVLNATGDASATNISVTTNATASSPDGTDITVDTVNSGTFTQTADNEVTTTLDVVLEPSGVDPNNIKLDPDRSDGSGFSSFTFGADQNVNKPTVDNTLTSGVKVQDGGSGFGGATVNLEFISTPNGSSGAQLNTTQLITNSNGEAFFNFTAGDTTGDYVVNATVEETGAGVNVTYTAQPGSAANVTVTPIENAIAGDSTEVGQAALFVNATDANGNPVDAGPSVSVTADTVGASEIGAFDDRASAGSRASVSGAGDDLTDGEFTIDSSDGSSVIEVNTDDVQDVTITAETSSGSDSGTVTFFDSVGAVDLSLNETTVSVDNRVAANATLRESAGGTQIEVPDISVDFDDNQNGNTTFANGGTDAAAINTDSRGVATAVVVAEQNGSATIDVVENLKSDSATLTVQPPAQQQPVATVTFDDKTVQNGTSTITVESAEFGGGAYNIVVHQASDTSGDGTIQAAEIGTKIGESAELSNGTASNVTVDIGKQVDPNDNVSQLTQNQTLVAMLHTTNTSDGDNITHASNIQRGGTPVFDEAEITVEQQQQPAQLAVSNLSAPANATVGDTISVSATVNNTGGQTATNASVAFRLDADQNGTFTDSADVEETQTVTLDAGNQTTVSYDVNTSGLGTGSFQHGVFTADDNATATITLQNATQQQPVATVTFDDKTVQNGTSNITVESAEFGGGEYNIVVHQASDTSGDGTIQAGEIGTKIGESAALSNGTASNVTVDIGKQVASNDNVSQLTQNQTLVAMLHTTNTSDGDNITHASPITRGGTPVFDEAEITVEQQPQGLDRFDRNGDGSISGTEVLGAIDAFENGQISGTDVLQVIEAFEQGTVPSQLN